MVLAAGVKAELEPVIVEVITRERIRTKMPVLIRSHAYLAVCYFPFLACTNVPSAANNNSTLRPLVG